jgi:hypothetical protein
MTSISQQLRESTDCNKLTTTGQKDDRIKASLRRVGYTIHQTPQGRRILPFVVFLDLERAG